MADRTQLFIREFEKLVGEKLQVFPDPFKPNTFMVPNTKESGYIETHTGYPVFVDEDNDIKRGLDYNTATEFYQFCKILYLW